MEEKDKFKNFGSIFGNFEKKESESLKEEQNKTSNENKIIMVSFKEIRPFKNHPFHLYGGDRKEDMVESIKRNGIINPILLRKVDEIEYSYEMLSGHNRMECGKLAGLTEGPAIVKENLTDEEALMYVIETNVLQRSFTDMPISERGAVISLRYSKMFSQGKRNDIENELKTLSNPLNTRMEGTS